MVDIDKSFPYAVVLLWLFPLTYLLHIAEEYWGGEGYPAYLFRVHGVKLSGTRFLILQSLGILLMVVGILIARRLKFPILLLLILATVSLTNALTHIVQSLLIAGYEPGLVSSVLVWLPLGAFTLFRLRAVMNGGRYLLGVAIGLAISAAIRIITLGGRAF
jgi:hypothetical protein